MGSDNTFGDTNFNPKHPSKVSIEEMNEVVKDKATSPEHQEKPFEATIENLREVLIAIQNRIDNPRATLYITSDLKECYNTISTSIDELESQLSSLESELKELRKESNKAIEIVKSLADWSRRYPRDRVYTMEKISMDNELIELEERAKAYTLNTEKN